MSCRFARPTDEYHGWECTETDGACMLFIPNETSCYEQFGDGPLAFDKESSGKNKCKEKDERNEI